MTEIQKACHFLTFSTVFHRIFTTFTSSGSGPLTPGSGWVCVVLPNRRVVSPYRVVRLVENSVRPSVFSPSSCCPLLASFFFFVGAWLVFSLFLSSHIFSSGCWLFSFFFFFLFSLSLSVADLPVAALSLFLSSHIFRVAPDALCVLSFSLLVADFSVWLLLSFWLIYCFLEILFRFLTVFFVGLASSWWEQKSGKVFSPSYETGRNHSEIIIEYKTGRKGLTRIQNWKKETCSEMKIIAKRLTRN